MINIMNTNYRYHRPNYYVKYVDDIYHQSAFRVKTVNDLITGRYTCT